MTGLWWFWKRSAWKCGALIAHARSLHRIVRRDGFTETDGFSVRGDSREFARVLDALLKGAHERPANHRTISVAGGYDVRWKKRSREARADARIVWRGDDGLVTGLTGRDAEVARHVVERFKPSGYVMVLALTPKGRPTHRTAPVKPADFTRTLTGPVPSATLRVVALADELRDRDVQRQFLAEWVSSGEAARWGERSWALRRSRGGGPIGVKAAAIRSDGSRPRRIFR